MNGLKSIYEPCRASIKEGDAHEPSRFPEVMTKGEKGEGAEKRQIAKAALVGKSETGQKRS